MDKLFCNGSRAINDYPQKSDAGGRWLQETQTEMTRIIKEDKQVI